MGEYWYLTLAGAVCGAVALVGYVRSLAGWTRPQRSVWLRGTIQQVREPLHGGSKQDGISVVVAYQDPETGDQVTVTNEGDRGETITAAWPGREIGVNHLRGRPHTYRFTLQPQTDGGRGLSLPNSALFLLYVDGVIALSLSRGWPWAMLLLAGPWAVFGALILPRSFRDIDTRRAELAGMVAAPGRVVAVLRDVSTDSEGSTSTIITPVITFQTAGDIPVLAFSPGLPDAEKSRGRELTVHYRADDPADFTVGLARAQRAMRWDKVVHVVALAVIGGAAVAGAVLLVG